MSKYRKIDIENIKILNEPTRFELTPYRNRLIALTNKPRLLHYATLNILHVFFFRVI